jgi:hypothetical protein
MMKLSVILVALSFGAPYVACSQEEASSGIDLRASVTAQTVVSNELRQAPRSGSPIAGGSRAVLYPTIKFDDNWFVSGAVELYTRPYYYQDLFTTGYGAKGNLLQATLNYSRVSDRGALLVRAGQMQSAFGAFLLRYDDNENALVDIPPGYGYYYSPVSFLGVAGAQIDVSRGRFDGRVQFANSSPANPRSIFARDQYGNWAGGGGYTVRQGFRVGVSGYRGPYLDRHYAYFFPGEANPSKLPAHGLGVDGTLTHRHTTAYIEIQKFLMPYTLFPSFRESTAYGEVRQVVSPRWFVAGRYSYISNSVTGKMHGIEASGAYRPDRYQLIKFSYEEQHHVPGSNHPNHTLGIQLITTLSRSFARE